MLMFALVHLGEEGEAIRFMTNGEVRWSFDVVQGVSWDLYMTQFIFWF